MTIADLKEKKILLLGLGVNHQELVRYLLKEGLSVTIRERDAKVKAAAETWLQAWEGQVAWETEGDIFDRLTEFDVFFRSPSLPYLSPAIQKAIKAGVICYSQTRLFFDLCPAKIVGITGTNGKGTTATLTYQMLEKGLPKGKRTFLGGNIGLDPFKFLDELTTNDVVVLELSSFQLQDLEVSPHVAVLLSVTPDHLNHHKDLAEYHEAKGALLRSQKEGDIAVVHRDNAVSAQLAAKSGGKVLWYSKTTPSRDAAWIDTATGEPAVFMQVNGAIDSYSLAGRKLLGQHNLENIMAASLVAFHFGVPVAVMREVATSFAGLEHRLQLVGEWNGITFVEDSISTSPETCAAALSSFPGKRIHLIAGGSSKGHKFAELAPQIVAKCASLSLLPGDASKELAAEVRRAMRGHKSFVLLQGAADPLFPTLLSGIAPHLQEGDLVLLSPAAASFASFANYKERGELFSAAVRERWGVAS